MWEQRPGGASDQRGGQRDRSSYPRARSSGGGAPPCHRCEHRSIFSLTLGIVRSMIEAGDDKLTSGVAGGRYKGRSRRSSRPTRPRGACELRRRVFPSGFPHHVEDFDPSHHFARIPTAGGATSAAAALPRIVTARGGRSCVTLRCQPRGYEYGYGKPYERLALVLPTATAGSETPGVHVLRAGFPAHWDLVSLCPIGTRDHAQKLS